MVAFETPAGMMFMHYKIVHLNQRPVGHTAMQSSSNALHQKQLLVDITLL